MDDARRIPRTPWKTVATFSAAVLATSAAFSLVGVGFQRYGVYVAESFGDRRLDAPRPAECRIAWLLLSDLKTRRLDAALAAAGLRGQSVGLRAFAWRSSGVRTPGQGADWRYCQGLGRYVRGLGLAPMGSEDLGPTVYLSRAWFGPTGEEATVWETFAAHPAAVTHGPDPPQTTAGWTARLARDAAGRWRIVSIAGL